MHEALNHFASPEFWYQYRRLPTAIQALADKNFDMLKANPRHPSLRLKRIGPLWSARVGLGHRALGKDRAEGIVWFWIGTHAEYDLLLR